MNGKVIWTNGKRIAAVFDSLRNNIRTEAGYLTIKCHKQLPPDNPLVWETAEVNCLAKAIAISRLGVRDLKEKVMD